MRACAVPVWQTKEILEVFRYAKESRATDAPLHILGFDSQAAPRLSRPARLGDVLADIDGTVAAEVRTADSLFLADYRVGRGNRHAQEHGEDLIAMYGAAERLLQSAPAGPNDRAFVIRVLRSARAHVRQLRARGQPGPASGLIRDSAMAENIAFLAHEMFPTARIVTWGHNFHLRHHNQSVRRVDRDELLPPTTGSMLRERFAPETYTIGMYVGSGQLGLVTRRVFDVKAPGPENGETLLMYAASRYAFFDLAPGDGWAAADLPFMWEGSVNLMLKPRDQYDGLIYIHETHPPSY